MFNAQGSFGFDDPERFLSAARGGMRRAAQRFDEYYRCYPMVMAPGPERTEPNHGSKIILPPSALDKVSRMHVQWPLTMELINGAHSRHSHAGVLEFIAEEGRAYLPQWMMRTLQLDVGDLIQLKTTSLELARHVKLQPQSTNFLEISDPKAVLEKAFRNFAALTKGDIFNFEYNDEVYDVAVLDVKPETDKMGVSMLETDVEVDFAPPVGYREPERPGPGASASTKGKLPVGGTLHSQGSMAKAINYNALAPSATHEQASNFLGEGQKIGSKKAGKTPASSSRPDAAGGLPARSGTSAEKGVVNTSRRNVNGPMPLRLPPNKLFLGYEIIPLKTKEQKDAEKENANRPYFSGQGQSLRGVVKKKDSSADRPKSPDNKEGEGRRLDGRNA